MSERSGGEECVSSTSIDNPFCQDENYPALIHNYFPPSVSISTRRCNKLSHMQNLYMYILYIYIPKNVFLKRLMYFLQIHI